MQNIFRKTYNFTRKANIINKKCLNIVAKFGKRNEHFTILDPKRLRYMTHLRLKKRLKHTQILDK